MDVDAFVAAHRHEWQRLEVLVSRRGRLAPAEADELVDLYQRTATHLSIARSRVRDPLLVARLSSLVARARSAVTGAPAGSWRDVGRFFAERFPATVYRAAPWWGTAAVASCALIALVAWWVAVTPEVQATIGTPEELRQLTRAGGDYEAYYSTHPASSFALEVWTHNAWVAALSIASGVLLGVPVIYVLISNAVNVGVGIGLMTAAGRLGLFLGLLTPHGLLELTAVFVAAGAGLKLGWTVIDPGPQSRSHAVAQEGRALLATALGLGVVLLVSGMLEAFITPSPLPTWARIGVGALAEAAFLAYVVVLGRRAVRAGERGDLDRRDAGDVLPTAG